MHPDIIVLDLTLRDGDGFRMISEFRASCPRARLLVFSMHAERAFIEAAIQAGADDYVVKEQGPEKLLQALDRLITRHCHDLEGMISTVLPTGRPRSHPRQGLPNHECPVNRDGGSGVDNERRYAIDPFAVGCLVRDAHLFFTD